MSIFFYISIVVVSAALTWMVRRIALEREILDHPNKRSSHTIPTPRGGGLAIVIAFYSTLVFYGWNYLDFRLIMALLFGLPLALVGFLDDIYDLSTLFRLGVQILCSLGALYFLEVPYLYWVFALLFVVWFINLFNFLDGIDGYLSTEVIFLSFAGYLFFNNSVWLILGAAIVGFLPFNWSRASIFMGDVGSTTIGFIIGVLILYDSTTFHKLGIWLLLTLPFWFDATFTLLRRFFRGEKFMQAHRKHLFQRAVRSGLSHMQVTLLLLSINIFILGLVLIFHNILWIAVLLSSILMGVIVYIIEKRVSFDT